MRAALFAALSMVIGCAAPLYADGWEVTWMDEFAGPAGSPPDPRRWVYDLGGGGWGNKELQVYTQSRENVFLDGSGHLVIRAIRRANEEYTSGRIKTLGRFAAQYGKVEARIKIPSGQGLWPAFWMLGAGIGDKGWPQCGEIDIMENIGKEPSVVHGTVHGPGYAGAGALSAQTSLRGGGRLSDDFHIYAVQWAAGEIAVFLDGVQYGRFTPASLPAGAAWVFDNPFFLLLNLAVGGEWPGVPDNETPFPSRMMVDWVKVWKSTGDAKPKGVK